MRIKAVIKKISFTGIQHLDDGSSNFIPANNKQLYLQVGIVLYYKNFLTLTHFYYY